MSYFPIEVKYSDGIIAIVYSAYNLRSGVSFIVLKTKVGHANP